MFTFFHKRQKVVLDVFTDDTVAFNCTPVVKASKLLPEWWKKLPNYGLGNAVENRANGKIQPNMKKCFGFTELYKKSFMVRNFSDLHIRISKENCKYFTLGEQPAFHPQNQYENGFPNHFNFKITSTWVFSEKTGIYFAILGAQYNLDAYNIIVLPGIDNYIIPQKANINLMLPHVKDDKQYDMYLPIGLPLYHVIPLTEKKVEIKCHLVTTNEIEKMRYKPPKTF